MAMMLERLEDGSPMTPCTPVSDIGSPKLCSDPSFKRKMVDSKRKAVVEASKFFQAQGMNALAVTVRDKKLTLSALKRFTDKDLKTEFDINSTQLKEVKKLLKKKNVDNDLQRMLQSHQGQTGSAGTWSPMNITSPRGAPAGRFSILKPAKIYGDLANS